MFNAMGLTAGPQYPPCELLPSTLGRGVNVSRSIPVMELMVLIAERPSAPARLAARATTRMSVMLGVSLTSTGVRAASFTHSVIICAYSGTCPTAEPMPRSLMPCGQPKFSSRPSAPAPSARFTISCQTSRFDSTISDAITACFG
jgi:hypothetical protein